MDTAVMGHLPDPVYVGAVALGAMIFSFVLWGFGFFRMGTTGIVAQVFSSGDTDGSWSWRRLLRSDAFGVGGGAAASP